MTKGEGLVALLYAIKGILEAGVIWVITGVAMLAFFIVIIKFIGDKFGLFGGNGGLLGSKKIEGNQIIVALFLLFIIFAIYPLIGLLAAIFGVNSSPTGGLLVN